MTAITGLIAHATPRDNAYLIHLENDGNMLPLTTASLLSFEAFSGASVLPPCVAQFFAECPSKILPLNIKNIDLDQSR